jgi:hypothetical protein
METNLTKNSMTGSKISPPKPQVVPKTRQHSINLWPIVRNSRALAEDINIESAGELNLAPNSYDKLEQFQSEMLKRPESHNAATAPVINVFAKNIYGRLLPIPAGTLVAGRIHKYEHICFLVSGRALITDHLGQRTLEGPVMEVSPAGISRVIFAETDCLLANFFGNVAKEEDMLAACTVETGKEFFEFRSN